MTELISRRGRTRQVGMYRLRTRTIKLGVWFDISNFICGSFEYIIVSFFLVHRIYGYFCL